MRRPHTPQSSSAPLRAPPDPGIHSPSGDHGSGPLEVLLLCVYFIVFYFVRRRGLSVAVLAHGLSMAFLVGTLGHYIEKVQSESAFQWHARLGRRWRDHGTRL